MNLNLEEITLKSGAHKSFDDGACIMELVSYVANEPWSDHPRCACPILTEYAIRLNDKFNDEHRQLMKPFIMSLIGTRATDEVKITRKRLIRWRNVTATYPLILDMVKLPELAEKLRTFENTLESMAEAAKFLKENKEKIYASADAYAYASASADAYAYASASASADAYASASASADAYADADAYASASASASAYAYADADADAYAIRSKIVDVSLETLRLAIEVNEHILGGSAMEDGK